MRELGILEIFFGPAWTPDETLSWAPFLKRHDMHFFFYGPKSDSHLRRLWRDEWPLEYIEALRQYSLSFRRHGIEFGVVLSPLEYKPSSDADRACLQEKIRLLEDIGIDRLGLFFDDMKWTEDAFTGQIQALQVAQSLTKAKILFCPMYYSDDPILDKVFGARPADYVAKIGEHVPAEIEIAWTGPKVISSEIPAEHLQKTAQVLRRAPFICDNFFANDGPKQCYFLKIKPAVGRSPEALSEASGWSFNPMNQCVLSQMVVLSAKLHFESGIEPQAALERAAHEVCGSDLGNWIIENAALFTERGLSSLTEDQKGIFLRELFAFDGHPAAAEMVRWLRGDFVVGSECLTD